jgi:hypothetical protein
LSGLRIEQVTTVPSPSKLEDVSMSVRVGGLLVMTGLTIALLFGSLVVVVGVFVSVCGGIVAAVGMESVLLEEGAESDGAPNSVDSARGDLAT